MSVKHRWLKISRQVHLYSGVFIAPALIFFAITGGLQSFSLHKRARDGSYAPPAWLVQAAQLHKKQTLVLPQRKSRPTQTARRSLSSAAPVPVAHTQNLLPMKIFFALVALTLLISVSSGVYMAYRYTRRPRWVSFVLVAGVAVPLALLLF